MAVGAFCGAILVSYLYQRTSANKEEESNVEQQKLDDTEAVMRKFATEHPN